MSSGRRSKSAANAAIFITLSAQHATGLGLSELLADLAAREEWADIELQRREWSEGVDLPRRSHHVFSGVSYHQLIGSRCDAARLGNEFLEKLPVERVV